MSREIAIGQSGIDQRADDVADTAAILLERLERPMVGEASARFAGGDHGLCASGIVDRRIYQESSCVECFFSKLKHFRRIATRYGQTARANLSVVQLAATVLWLR